MSLEHKDLEVIESLIYKYNDDIAVSISRSFERLETHIDNIESRLSLRMGELDDRVETARQDIADMIGEFRQEIRDFVRLKEEFELD